MQTCKHARGNLAIGTGWFLRPRMPAHGSSGVGVAVARISSHNVVLVVSTPV